MMFLGAGVYDWWWGTLLGIVVFIKCVQYIEVSVCVFLLGMFNGLRFVLVNL